MRRGIWLGFLSGLLAASAPAWGALEAEQIASGLDSPVYVTAPPDDPRLFIVERDGTIVIWASGSVLPTPFLDISSQVTTLNTGGLVGLAFPPDYATSGLFYVYYTRTDGDNVLSRFEVSGNPDVADGSSEDPLLEISNPTARHNGGTIAFRPTDGYLYLAMGDGGGLYDPDEVAQDPQELRGKVLRLDASGGAGSPLTIPSDNPFVGNPAVRDEIWALGLRNPYRWSFDRQTGDLWIGDVGEADREEISFESAGEAGGRNYGWDIMEGAECNPTDPSPAFPCNDPALTLPVHDYDQSNGNCSVSGGYVYRGQGPARGLYFFADFCTARIWTLDRQSLAVTDRSAELAASLPGGITIDRVAGFGEDASGGLYVVDNNGEVFRIRSVSEGVPALPTAALGVLCLALLAARALVGRRGV